MYINASAPSSSLRQDDDIKQQLKQALDMIHGLSDKVCRLEQRDRVDVSRDSGSRYSDAHDVASLRGKVDTLQHKLKESNNRIRYLVDENDKLIGRLNRYKSLEKSRDGNEALYKQEMGIMLEEIERLKQANRQHEERERELLDVVDKHEHTIKKLISKDSI